MSDLEPFWVESGCAPGMSPEETQAYIEQIGEGYRANGNPSFAELFMAHTRELVSRPRPGPSLDQIEAWERDRGFRLPSTLRDALQIQDGGYVRGADLYLHGLADMKPLSEADWDHLWEYEDNRELGDPEKLVVVGAFEKVAGLLVLDGNVSPEPRVLYLWRDLGDEIREGDRSFDDLIEGARKRGEEA